MDVENYEELLKERFQHRVKLREIELKEFLVKEVRRVSEEITKRIPAVPVGDYRKTKKNPHPFRLPDRDNWFDGFWLECCLHVKQTKLFLQVNQHYITTTSPSIIGNDHPVEQNIYINSCVVKNITTQVVRRSNGDLIAEAVKALFHFIMNPAEWFIGLFKK